MTTPTTASVVSQAGMLLEAMKRFDIDRDQSFMVGRPMEGRGGRARAGCRTIQVGSLDEGALSVAATIRRVDLADAASWILSQEVKGIDP